MKKKIFGKPDFSAFGIKIAGKDGLIFEEWPKLSGIFRKGRRKIRISDFPTEKDIPQDACFFMFPSEKSIFPIFGEPERNPIFQSRLFRSRSLSRSEIFCRAYTAPFMVRMLCIPISI